MKVLLLLLLLLLLILLMYRRRHICAEYTCWLYVLGKPLTIDVQRPVALASRYHACGGYPLPVVSVIALDLGSIILSVRVTR